MKPLHSYMIQYCRSAESEIHIIKTLGEIVIFMRVCFFSGSLANFPFLS